MAVDLTFFNKKHQNDLAFATEEVQHILNIYHETNERDIYLSYIIPFSDKPKHKYEVMHEMMVAIFFSSGYLADIKMTNHENDYKFELWLTVMTPEQKEEGLFIPSPKN
jgi:hypothetical protein